MNNDEKFKKAFPGIKAEELLCAKTHKVIKIKRLINILNGKAKRITTVELCYIASALNVKLSELVK